MEYLDFATSPGYTKEDVKKLQNHLLEMAKITTSILDKYHYHYMLAFGTLLGAVRHQGFIPWDDDFDIFLFDDEYNDAVECLRKELPEWIIVHDKKTDPIYWPAWSRLRDIHSRTRASLFPDDNAYQYTGIDLDLYRLKKMDHTQVQLWKKKSAVEFLVRKHEVGVLPDDIYNECFDKWTSEYTELLNQPVENNVRKEVFAALNPTLPEYLEIDDVFPLKKYRFGDTEFWGPNNADVVLRASFGDYMEIPPYEQRHVHYDLVEYI